MRTLHHRKKWRTRGALKFQRWISKWESTGERKGEVLMIKRGNRYCTISRDIDNSDLWCHAPTYFRAANPIIAAHELKRFLVPAPEYNGGDTPPI